MDINQMNLEDYESTLRRLADLWDLCRSEHLSKEQQLSAIDHAIGLAIGGPPEQARDFVRDVALGLIEG
jgi:hypothetical protein